MSDMDRSSNGTSPKKAKGVAVLALACAVFLWADLSAVHATYKCGQQCDKTWTTAGSPYIVTCDVTVPTDCSLTIDAGVEVRFQAGTGLEVFGTLWVIGTSGAEVTFTSDAASPQAGDWSGVNLRSGSNSTLDYATLDYAVNGIYIENATAGLDHVTLSHNANGVYVYGFSWATLAAVTARFNDYGLQVYYGDSTVDVWGSTFTENEVYGVYVDGYSGYYAPEVTITGSSIHSNLGAYDLYTRNFNNPSQRVVDAQGNWWDTTNGAAIAGRIYDQLEHTSSPMVDWCRYLDGPGGVPRDVHCPDLAVCGETVVWDRTDKPYLVVSDVVVCPTGTLQVEPGVEALVVPQAAIGLEVSGTLAVNGSSGSEVLLASDAASPQAGDWSGVNLHPGSSGTLDYATVSHAANGVYIDNTVAALDHVTTSHNTTGVYVYRFSWATLAAVTARFNDYGLQVYYGDSTVDVSGSTFTENTLHGVYVDGYSGYYAPEVTITGSSLHSNLGAYDLYTRNFNNPSQRVVDAQGNWWGTMNGAAIAGRIYDQLEHTSSPLVDWCRYLDGPGGVPREVHCPDLAVCGETVVWDRTDKPYLVVSDVVVCPTGTLQVEPGVEALVVPQAAIGLEVSGTLAVNGSSGSEVLLASDAAWPQAGDWSGVNLHPGSSGTLDYATVSHAANGVYIDNTVAALDHVTLSHNTTGVYVYRFSWATLAAVTARFNDYGLQVYYGDSTVDVSGSTFTENTLHGVYVDGYSGYYAPEVMITGSSLHSNLGAYDLYTRNFNNPSQRVVDAQGNWWGTMNGAAIAGRIYDQLEHTSSPLVDWCRYLDGPGGVPRDVHCPDLAVCSETVVWDRTDKPYLVVSDVVVCPTGTLQVEPGVEALVVPQAAIGLEVSGTLAVNGSSGSEVLLASDAASPQAGDWSGVNLHPGSSGTLDYATVSHAATGVYIDNSVAALDHVTLSRNTTGVYVYRFSWASLAGVTARFNDYGLQVYYGDSTVDVSGSTFTENTLHGVYVDGYSGYYAPEVTITGSSLHSNLGAYDLYTRNFNNPSQRVVDAQGNWWGTMNGAAIAGRIYDQLEHTSSPLVDWCRYLDGPGGVPREVHCPDLAVCGETVVWDRTDKPYLVVSDVVVCPTGTLQVEPGVEALVVPQAAIGLEVSGTLAVNGSSGSEVLLASDAASPQAGDWSGVNLHPGSSGTLDYATVSHAANGVYIDNTVAALDHVTLSHNANGVYVYGFGWASLAGVTARFNDYGLQVYYGDSTVDVSGSTFTENTLHGVYVDGYSGYYAPEVTITGSSLHSNLGAYDLYTRNFNNPSQRVVDAQGNWWGTMNGAAIAGRIYDQLEHTSSPLVDWCRYLDGPGGVPRDVHCPDLAVCGETVVWDRTDKPYLVVSDVVVCPTGTLQVEPGVEALVVPQAAIGLEVSGTLAVNGSSGSEVLLASDAASPQAGDWSGVNLHPGSGGTLDHAAVSHAANGVYIDNSVTALEHVTLSHNGKGVYVYGFSWATLAAVTARLNDYGLHVYYGDSTIDVSGSTFTENTLHGVYVDGYSGYYAPEVMITGSSLHSNLGDYDLYTRNFSRPDTTLVWALDNWWGTKDHDLIRDRIYDQDDHSSSPRVWFRPFGPSCDIAICDDRDGDSRGDFEDNCAMVSNADQADSDGDRMGDACDPDPGAAPVSDCDGFNDLLDGYLDSDGDDWGDPCDFQPTLAGCYPGAPEICDGRDNDGDGLFVFGELIDEDYDRAIACGDCDDTEPEVYPCACEVCVNLRDDDCDSFEDGADSDCEENPNCIILAAGAGGPEILMGAGVCGGESPSGPFDVIRGFASELRIAAGSVDLGSVTCVAGDLPWDRATDLSADPNQACNDPAVFYLAKDGGASDYGAASSGERRETMDPDPACP